VAERSIGKKKAGVNGGPKVPFLEREKVAPAKKRTVEKKEGRLYVRKT